MSSLLPKKDKAYMVWNNMLRRCYSGEVYKFPTYQDCTVCEEWKNYSVFRKWYYNNYIEGFELDKDLTSIGNTVYSPEFCSFVPKEVNSLLTDTKAKRGKYPLGVTTKGNKFRAQCLTNMGRSRWFSVPVPTPEEAFNLYKIKKEEIIKEVATYYRESLSNTIYDNLINYVVKDDSGYVFKIKENSNV